MVPRQLVMITMFIVSVITHLNKQLVTKQQHQRWVQSWCQEVPDKLCYFYQNVLKGKAWPLWRTDFQSCTKARNSDQQVVSKLWEITHKGEKEKEPTNLTILTNLTEFNLKEIISRQYCSFYFYILHRETSDRLWIETKRVHIFPGFYNPGGGAGGRNICPLKKFPGRKPV